MGWKPGPHLLSHSCSLCPRAASPSAPQLLIVIPSPGNHLPWIFVWFTFSWLPYPQTDTAVQPSLNWDSLPLTITKLILHSSLPIPMTVSLAHPPINTVNLYLPHCLPHPFFFHPLHHKRKGREFSTHGPLMVAQKFWTWGHFSLGAQDWWFSIHGPFSSKF